MILLCALFALLLFVSWFLFVRFWIKFRAREQQTYRKVEESRRQLQEQSAGLDTFLELLSSVQELATENPNPETRPSLYEKILDSGCRLLRCSFGSLMLVDKATQELFIAASRGSTDPDLLKFRLKVGEGVAGRVAESGKTIVVENVNTDPRFLNERKVEYSHRSLISVPLKIKNKVLGVLNLHAKDPYPHFQEREVRFVNLLAAFSAIALEDLDLYLNLQHYYFQMVEALARALECKEVDLQGHPVLDHQTLRRYARSVSESLNLPEPIVKFVEYASIVHGIGKMGIDEAILRKPGKLTSEEYEKVKKHPEIAQQIISNVAFLSPIVPMVLYHQERWDGRGYPAGLKGEEIPLGSRIVAVLNAYQAMVSEKPYRPALSRDQAIAELRKGAGSQFDPKVVEAFVGVIEKQVPGASALNPTVPGPAPEAR